MHINEKLQYRLLQRNIRYSYLDGISYCFMMGVIVPYLGLYILRFNGPPELVSLIVAVQPVVLFVVSLAAASYVNSFERKKMVTVPFGFMVRLFILFIALIPFLPEAWRAQAFFILWALTWVPWGFCSLSWSPMMCNIVPESQRGTFFGVRTAMTGISSFLGTLVTGIVLARFPFLSGFTVLLLISFVCVMISQYFLSLHMEPVVAQPGESKRLIRPRAKGLNLIANLQTFQHPEFGRIFSLCCLALFIFHSGYSMAIPLYTLRQVQQLGFDNGMIALITIAQSLTAFAGSYIGGRGSDRWGYRYVFLFSTMVSVIPPLIWVASSQLPWLVFASMLAGLSGNAYMICFSFMTLAVSPYEDRSRFLAVNTAVGNLAGTLGPLLGMLLTKLPEVGIEGSLLISAGLMLSGALFAFNVAKTGAF